MESIPVGNEGAIAFFGSDNPGVPSVEAAKLWAKPQNIPNFDFFNYAGTIVRFCLYTTPEMYVDDITLVPSIDGADGIVEYDISVKGRAGEQKAVLSEMTAIEILDENRSCVARGCGCAGKLRIPQAKLWWPWPGIHICIRPGFPVEKMFMNSPLVSVPSE